ncbi:two-component system sensor histidine kinase CreC [Pseudorhodoferax sp. Leaf267]|uniref:two-component system sensor histidine kinase CreC n=1 Tax=Pseudorhodoferax sp. Leaf267 TaxID=1736316 RepID=UPI0006F518FD|nr:two-component system sensor histidine kinase CreC [Pseudorhodoferax sp. Leaf267]KQP12487.1 histidine kinase [Pseudorhodoferax sp. Leaf267]
MSRRTRIFVGMLAIYVAGIAFLLVRVVGDIDPRYRESAEESLVDTANLMASLIEQDVHGERIEPARLEPLLRNLYARQFDAEIYGLRKTRVDLRLYVTDADGRVIFDAQRERTGQHLGENFVEWRDVRYTLDGLYGARTSRDVAHDATSSVMYVAAPIRSRDRVTIGVVSVGKPVQSFGKFVQDARWRTIWVGVGSALALLVGAVIVSVWLVRPFGLVRDYLAWTRTQPRLRPGPMARHAVATLRSGVHEMRDALTGRNTVADYVQTLTHEIKSPLSAIRGAAELLEDPAMPAADRERFLANITRETQRVQEIVDRMMELTALESRRVLEHAQAVPLAPLLEELAASHQAAAAARGLRLDLALQDQPVVWGDPFLLRRAVANLLANAMDFASAGSAIELGLHATGRRVRITVRDHGPGIPAYAQAQVFQKFYSLARPASGKRSTGLGLAFVQEIAQQHGGKATLENAAGGGALATLGLPARKPD